MMIIFTFMDDEFMVYLIYVNGKYARISTLVVTLIL